MTWQVTLVHSSYLPLHPAPVCPTLVTPSPPHLSIGYNWISGPDGCYTVILPQIEVKLSVPLSIAWIYSPLRWLGRFIFDLSSHHTDSIQQHPMVSRLHISKPLTLAVASWLTEPVLEFLIDTDL